MRQSPRARQVAESLVRHLHAFVAEVAPTEAEWFAGIDFLTRAGHITTDTRQELVLLSDVLGVSMLVIGINHPAPDGATEATVFGPFFVEGAPELANGADLAAGASGRPCLMRGRILRTDGSPVAGAVIDVWQADDHGLYDVQYDDLDSARGRGRLRSEADGRFWFWSVLPVAYPIPSDGPAGELLRAGGRDPMRPAHVHFRVDRPRVRDADHPCVRRGRRAPGERRGVRGQALPDRALPAASARPGSRRHADGRAVPHPRVRPDPRPGRQVTLATRSPSATSW